MTILPYNLSKLRDKIIAIDGPSGSGKSTTARLVAARLGYSYLDTGAMYRALTWLAIKNSVKPSDGEKLTLLAESVEIKFETHEDINRVFINGSDVTTEIREEMVTKLVSEVSAHQGVRKAMVAQQMELGKAGSIVAEGRDTTTVVFPKADLKIYLDSDVKTRAQRRFLELVKMGVSTKLEDIEADLIRRDNFDSSRKHSPLTKAIDARMLDTTNLTIEEQVSQVISIFKSVIK